MSAHLHRSKFERTTGEAQAERMSRVALLLILGCASALRLPAATTMHSRRFVLLAALPAAAALPRNAAHAADFVPLHRIDYPKQGMCGEADVPEKGVFFVKTLGGFSDGTCAAAGYPVKQGTANGTGEKDKEKTYDIYSK